MIGIKLASSEKNGCKNLCYIFKVKDSTTKHTDISAKHPFVHFMIFFREDSNNNAVNCLDIVKRFIKVFLISTELNHYHLDSCPVVKHKIG